MQKLEVDTLRLATSFFKTNDSKNLFESYTGRIAESQYLARLPHSSVAETLLKLSEWSNPQSWVEHNRVILVIEDKKNRQAIGQLTLFNKPQHLEFHFGISHDYSGQGYVSELLAGLVESELANNNRLMTYCDCNHKAAQRVLEKVGFQSTGLLKRHYQNPNKGNQWVDCFSYQWRKEEK
ncbi:GNAT family N-acetyltransferase [Endozoicomonas numazuensis]|uniref:N-acetyltransferase domain-containing protein n=1 Tax=Endozoicomonas numazuensis TaxID=1137799 RepID=A0A081NEM6_9GAMM|nr:GNAT family protein [Endozoicomonas numazuensis]KEQ16899.1 hypothetical protein GZ78_19815 [Endozoicomonas numazuensis]